jgi:hypothetical protein
LSETLDHPEFATAIGLVKYGSLRTRRVRRPSVLRDTLKNVFGKVLPR